MKTNWALLLFSLFAVLLFGQIVLTPDPIALLQDADDKAITAERMANQWTIQSYQARDVFTAAHKAATETCKGKLARESGIWKCKEEPKAEAPTQQ